MCLAENKPFRFSDGHLSARQGVNGIYLSGGKQSVVHLKRLLAASPFKGMTELLHQVGNRLQIVFDDLVVGC